MNDFQNWLSKSNKIWLVGTGSLDCYPKPDCKDMLCEMARKGGKDKRLCASSIFYDGILFDNGPGVWSRVSEKVKPKAIVLSHSHFDHIADLMFYRKISETIPVYASRIYEPIFKKLEIKANYFEPDSGIKELKIDSRQAIHTFTRPVVLLRYKDIAWAPDLGELTNEDLKWASGVKYWFGDGFSFEDDFVIQNEKLHQSMQKLLLRLKKIKSLELVIFVGIGHHSKWPHEDLELMLRQFAFRQTLNFGIELGFDNQIIGAPKI